MKTLFSRRSFLRTSALSGTALLLLPNSRLAFAYAANGKLNVAGIGVGGQGRGDLDNIAGAGANIVGLCDVDRKRAGDVFQKHPQAKPFTDFRRMLDELDKEIDAVLVATPDHTHAVAAVAAMKRGKHVYCEKPLAHSIYEVRQLMKAAQKYKVVTQLGNQGHSFESIRFLREWIQDGAIGNVHTIDAGCRAVNSGLDDLPRLKEEHQIPPTLDWDLWLGPAQYRPYHPAYPPSRWRGGVRF